MDIDIGGIFDNLDWAVLITRVMIGVILGLVGYGIKWAGGAITKALKAQARTQELVRSLENKLGEAHTNNELLSKAGYDYRKDIDELKATHLREQLEYLDTLRLMQARIDALEAMQERLNTKKDNETNRLRRENDGLKRDLDTANERIATLESRVVDLERNMKQTNE